MTAVDMSNTLQYRVKEAVMDAWQTTTPSKTPKWRLVRVTVQTNDTLAAQIGWQSDLAAVYSVIPGSGVETLGLGCAHVIEALGIDAVSDLQAQMARAKMPAEVRWFGAFSFDSSIAPKGVWSEWPNAVWFCPTLTLTHAFATERVEALFLFDGCRDVRDVEQTLNQLLSQSEKPKSPLQAPLENGQSWLHQAGLMVDQADWSQLIQDALVEIRRGGLEKVVLARQTSVHVGTTLTQTLDRLTSAYSTSHVFAMQWRGQWLIGASPEQLIRVDDGVLRVDCLAGSTARGDTPSADEALAETLLASRKNRAEHAAVVRFVAEQLQTVAQALKFSDEPMMKKLANVQHLYTPIRGRLRPGQHLLDAAHLLHPTPAVGGVPRPDALSFIREREGWPRGYYAGAFGYIGENGDGLLSVALRTALVRYPAAVLFAGCGIVEGSDGDDEWRETELKLTPMRMALK